MKVYVCTSDCANDTFVGKLTSFDVEMWIGVDIEAGVMVAIVFDAPIDAIGVFDVIVDAINNFKKYIWINSYD